ncbi:hypothetical protein TSUD_119710 [Trifolium subterraneum]|uniref:Reverse transcriptase zinc-binding domain-containing protein n=1 Tax=Trifolium subterraneum TaxID=3900 RepID=A0A2Z6NSQ8_TRISU|nr:hypothetical protein TSUD_119710 [Trifolium subterraneum]
MWESMSSGNSLILSAAIGAVCCISLKGFKICNDGPIISHLQYADDTLCIGEASVENLWSMKAILRGFELASGLKVNFLKSCLIGVNVGDNFLDMACTFLNCMQGGIPFKYFGLPVGANPRLLSTWNPLVEKIRKNLNPWGNKHLSLGCRLVLINSVLNSIPIFYLSFLKMPKHVIKKVTRIQREFLWGGVNGGKKISWVKWKVVCQDKKNGGLGVRFWWLNMEGILCKMLFGQIMLPRIMRPFGGKTSVILKLVWTRIGGWRRRSFEYLANVRELRVGSEDRLWAWNLRWRRNLFQWEEDEVTHLMNLLDSVTLSNEEDGWRWTPDPEGIFSVNSAFGLFSREIGEAPNLSSLEKRIFSFIWKSPAPSKVTVFIWQLLHNRIPTKDNLFLRGVIQQGTGCNCVWCGEVLESATHLFLHCRVMIGVWYEIFKWLGVVLVMPPNLFYLLDCVNVVTSSKKARNGFLLIWNTAIWSIWRMRNNIIFNGITKEPWELVEEVKVLSWKWSVDRLKIAHAFFMSGRGIRGVVLKIAGVGVGVPVWRWGVLFLRDVV